MMHPEAYRGVHWAIRASGFANELNDGPQPTYTALDLGGVDVNGTARVAFQPLDCFKWTGADLAPGPGVDVTVDATQPIPDDMHGAFDVVLCTEVLEHVEDWVAVLKFVRGALASGGWGFITCASTGRRPHGARGAMNPAPGEWYHNIAPEELRAALAMGFHQFGVQYNPNPGDAYAWVVL